MSKKILFFLFICFTVACSKIEQATVDYGYVRLSLDSPTKCSLSGDKTIGYDIAFETNENILLAAYGINDIKMTNKETDVNTFDGSFVKIGSSSYTETATYYAFYPYTWGNNKSVSLTLPERQSAPFDTRSLFMYSQGYSGVYDEDNMPSFTNVKMKELFGTIALSITNSSSEYTNEAIKEISIEIDDGCLTGGFTYDFANNGVFKFATSQITGSRKAVSYFNVQPKVSTNPTVYLNVNTIEMYHPTIRVYTTNYILSYSSSFDFTVEAGKVSVLKNLDLANFKKERTSPFKISCWGDSYSIKYPGYLSSILGSRYSVNNYNGSGANTMTIMSAQGGLGLKITKDLKVPFNSTLTVDKSAICVVKNSSMQDELVPISDYGFRDSYFNPCTINGISYKITGTTIECLDKEKGSTFIPAGSDVYTYGYTNFGDSDVTVIYIGQNGIWGTSSTSSIDDINILIKEYQAMASVLTKGKYIVLGFHNYRHNETYKQAMLNAFGDKYVDLHDEVCDKDKYEQMLIDVGLYTDKSEIVGTQDEKFVNMGYWPANFYNSYVADHPESGDCHPSEYGGKAIALLVYRKMQELGYIDN